MSKRKLTDQQLRRIRDKQTKASSTLNETTLSAQQEGLIISHYGQQLDVKNLEDHCVYRCYARSNLPSLACGDRVLWRKSIQENAIEPPSHDADSSDNQLQGVIDQLLPRDSVIERPHPHRGLKPIAANINTLVIVFASEPEPYDNLIDRYLIAAAHANLTPILVLNKIDLLANNSDYLTRFSHYSELGYTFLKVSSTTSENIDALTDVLVNTGSIFVGQSGVGKSSLLNCILPDAHSTTGALSNSHNKGRHTTTTSCLYELPNGGHIIDSPGIREFGLWHLDKSHVIKGYVEFHGYLAQCKFRDCSHKDNIKGCAIQLAAQDGLIHPQRLASYFSILNSFDEAVQK